MRIRTVLILTLASALLLVVALGLASWRITAKLNEVIVAEAQAQASSQEITKLLLLTHEYELHGEERAAQQWKQRLALFVGGTAEGRGDAAATRLLLPKEASDQIAVLQELFERLEATSQAPETPVQARRQKLLIDQILTHVSLVAEIAARWNDHLQTEHQRLHHLEQTMDKIFFLAMLMLLSALLIVLSRRVLQPLARLHAAVRAVAKGDLTVFSASTAKDELGDLSRNFDAMAIDMVSDLRREVAERKQAEAAVNESGNRLTAVMENLTEGLVMADHAGLVTYWNPMALAINGFANMDDCRRPFAELAEIFEFRLPNEDRPLPVEDWPMSRVLRGEKLHDWEVRLRRLDQGWEKIIAYSGWLIHNASGETFAFLSITDITEQKRAALELAKIESQRFAEMSAALEVQNQAARAALSLMEDALAAQERAESLSVALNEQLDELRRWQQVTLNRESRILSVKKEINDLLAAHGQPPRYPSALDEGAQA